MRSSPSRKTAEALKRGTHNFPKPVRSPETEHITLPSEDTAHYAQHAPSRSNTEKSSNNLLSRFRKPWRKDSVKLMLQPPRPVGDAPGFTQGLKAIVFSSCEISPVPHRLSWICSMKCWTGLNVLLIFIPLSVRSGITLRVNTEQ